MVASVLERGHEHGNDPRRRRDKPIPPGPRSSSTGAPSVTASSRRRSGSARPPWPPTAWLAGDRVAVVDGGSLLSIAMLLGGGAHRRGGGADESRADTARAAGAAEERRLCRGRRRGGGLRRPAPRSGRDHGFDGVRPGEPPRASVGPRRHRHADDARRAGPVHQRHDRTTQGGRHHQRAAEYADHRMSRDRSVRM